MKAEVYRENYRVSKKSKRGYKRTKGTRIGFVFKPKLRLSFKLPLEIIIPFTTYKVIHPLLQFLNNIQMCE